jgi:uncharacterized protein
LSKVSKAAQKREEKRIENEAKIRNANDILKQVLQSGIAPSFARKEMFNVLNILNDPNSDVGIRAANAVSSLEGLTRGPNVSSSLRVAVWSAISILESVREA